MKREFPVIRLQVLLFLSSAVCLVFLFMAAYQENFTPGWRSHQAEYNRQLAAAARAAGQRPRPYPTQVRQAYLPDWGVVDRCVSCHVAVDNPAFADKPQPLASHSGNLLKFHPPDRFGCSICHQGQGRALAKDAAHGHVPFWTEPLLTGDFVQATCAKCHHEEEVPSAPVLSRGRQLLVELGCVGCHQTGDLSAADKAGPRLSSIGSKVTRKWLNKWLASPQSYLPHARMPRYDLRPNEVNALAAYLMTFRDPAIDKMADPEGDYDAGANVYRESQCIVCHVTKVDYNDNPVGGTIGPDLRKIGNKVSQKWLVVFFKNPHAFLPNTKMPRYHFSDKEVMDLAQYVHDEWVDFDLLDAEEKTPEPPAGTPAQIATGKRLFAELGCTGCHQLLPDEVAPVGPDLTYIGSRPVHQLNFGAAQLRHTLPDFLFTKVTQPRSLHHPFQLPVDQAPSQAIWLALRPTSVYSQAATLPDGNEETRLAWILQQTQRSGLLDKKLELPAGNRLRRAEWLVEQLRKSQALNPLKMPQFRLSDEDAEAVTIALMSLSDVSAPSKRFEVPAPRKAIFDPQDNFGLLVQRYRCTSCHKIRDSGQLLASDLTWEGSRVQRDWLYHYLNKPYSMRRMLTIAMPIFHFPEVESRLMADYIAQVLVQRRIGTGWDQGHDKANAKNGAALYNAKGCNACHQLQGKGGDVGPSLTTQVPRFPVGTWVGDKLRPQWIYQWLKNPQALLPATIEPNLDLGDQELLDLTAYLAGLKNPDYQQPAAAAADSKPAANPPAEPKAAATKKPDTETP